uniref:Uncharacterized protein n=1 Tax=Echeneis naucrates TaxID=173247 RepID=A0A665TYK1_ECHNA
EENICVTTLSSVCLSAFFSADETPRFRRSEQPGGEAAHVLRHPAVLHRHQPRPHHLLQVGRASPPPLQVGGPPGLTGETGDGRF